MSNHGSSLISRYQYVSLRFDFSPPSIIEANRVNTDGPQENSQRSRSWATIFILKCMLLHVLLNESFCQCMSVTVKIEIKEQKLTGNRRPCIQFCDYSHQQWL